MKQKGLVIANDETEKDILLQMIAETSLQIINMTEETPGMIILFGETISLDLLDETINKRKDRIDYLERCLQK